MNVLISTFWDLIVFRMFDWTSARKFGFSRVKQQYYLFWSLWVSNVSNGLGGSFFELGSNRTRAKVKDLKKICKKTLQGRILKTCISCICMWSFGFPIPPGQYFSDNRWLPFYFLKIGFLEYLRISGEIQYTNGPIGYWKKVTIWKEACIVNVGAVIRVHDYLQEGQSDQESASHGKIALPI